MVVSTEKELPVSNTCDKFILRSLKRLMAVLCISMVFTLPAANASGRLQYLLGGDSFRDGSQKINFDVLRDEMQDPDINAGFGFLYDSNFRRGGAFSVDYYSLSETSNQGAPDEIDNTFHLFSLGFRYHLPLNLYLGLAAGGVQAQHEFARKTTRFRPAILPVYTFGWTYISPFKLAIGLHLLRTSPTKLESDEAIIGPFSILADILNEDGTEVEDFTINMVGLTIGFAW